MSDRAVSPSSGVVVSGSISLAAVLGWIAYDFANTIFSLNVVSRYFGPWILDRGASDLMLGAVIAVSGLVVALVSPLLGVISDQLGRRMPLLIGCTLACVAATVGLGMTGSVWSAFLLFALANVAYQAGLIVYDALLPVVSRTENRGRISGFGVGAGYLGAVIGLYLVQPFAGEGDERQGAFIPTALLFLFFALPAFLFIRERSERRGKVTWSAARGVVRQLRETIDHAGRYPDLRRFILSRFLYADAMSTIIVVMAIYAERAVGMSDAGIDSLLALSIVFAVIGGFGGGFFVERWGPRRVLGVVLIGWMVTLGLAMVMTSVTMFYAIGPMIGILLGATWTSDRVVLTRLAPPEHIGEFFGLYGLAGKLAGVVGPLVWAATVEIARYAGLGHSAYRVAVGVLTIAILLGYLGLRPVRDDRPIATFSA